jgi:hypothetical protein
MITFDGISVGYRVVKSVPSILVLLIGIALLNKKLHQVHVRIENGHLKRELIASVVPEKSG